MDLVLIGNSLTMAADAWTFGPVDFLKRPLDSHRVASAGERLVRRVCERRILQVISAALSENERALAGGTSDSHDHALVETVALEADGNYVKAFLRSGTVVRVRSTFEEFHLKRVPFLFRVHRSWAISLGDVKELVRAEGNCQLRMGENLIVPVGPTYVRVFISAMRECASASSFRNPIAGDG